MSKKWEKIWEREYPLNRVEHVMQALNTSYTKKTVGFYLSDILAISFPNGNAALYFSSPAWQKFKKFIIDIFKNRKKFQIFFSIYETTNENFLKVCQRTNKLIQQKPGAQEVIKIFQNYLDALSHNMLIGQWWGYCLSELSSEIIRQFMCSKIQDPKEQEKFLSIIFTPEKMSEIRKERMHLLKIALEKDKEKQNAMLQKHTRQFQWIPCVNIFLPAPWTENFFRKELEKIIKKGEAKKELQEIKKRFNNAGLAFKKLRLRYSVKQRVLIDHAHVLAFIRDDRDDVRRFGYFLTRPLYQRICQILSVSPKDLVFYTSDEILKALEQNKKLSKKEILSRKNGWALVVKNKKIVVKTGREYGRLYKAVERKNKKEKTEIKGISASPGIVQGVCRIAPSVFLLNKVKKGDILVTVATHPDYLPAMRRAKAIVTDEGGLTSHAAIVSRELGIPCIVGTKIATKIFKDGQLVEVDANKGVVRIIK